MNISSDNQIIKENNWIKYFNSFKNDKDILNVSSSNNSLNLDKKKFLNKKTMRDWIELLLMDSRFIVIFV